MKYIKMFIWVVVMILFIDFVGFIAWSTSGQKPVDNFHAGIGFETIIKLIK